ncbi:MAG: cyclodeaminase/cyclohydrolase family protein [Clostridiales bacterium]|nr:cyclodeaminase/cyclohydrolase family protein [Clostridiales bacterium]
MEQMTEKSCSRFLEELAGKAPVPGGGGAAALVGAVGVALGNMVGSLTTGKKKYAAVEEDIQRLNARAEALRRELEALVTADAEAFAPLSKAYGLPKGTPEEAAHKEQVMEAALEDACAVPMRIMMRCCDALDLIEEYAEKGSVMAVSDAGCAAAFCKAALQAASLNVFINTKAMQDRNRANQLNLEADILLSSYQPKADQIFDRVNRGLRTYRY